MKKSIILFCLSCLCLSAFSQTEKFHPRLMTIKMNRQFKENNFSSQHLLSGFSTLLPTKGGASLENKLKKMGAISLRPVFHTSPAMEEKHKAYDLDLYYYVDFNKAIHPKQWIVDFGHLEGVELVEAVDMYEVNEEKRPNDSRFIEQWCFDNSRFAGVDINIFGAWEITTGNPRVIVAIIDNCFDITHSDLKGNLWINAGEIPNNDIDDDGNGYTDDIHGWNFYTNNNNVSYDKPSESHGTHVGGIVAAQTHNRKGIAGVAGGWNGQNGARVMVFRAGYTNFSSGKSYVSHGYDCMIYAADNGAAITQCSWGGGGISDLGQTSIRYFTEQGGGDVMNGGLVIAAAGNDHSSEKSYPAAHQSVLAVGSIQASGALSDFSNFGDWVEISAPGTRILSTIPDQGYGELNGTSMACPIVSGVAALVLSASLHMEKETKSPEWLKNVLIRTGKSMPYEEPMGPLINAQNAVVHVADPEAVGVVHPLQEKADAVLWPNPTQDEVHIGGLFAKHVQEVNVFSMDGRMIYSAKVRHGRFSLSSLSSGFYIVKLIAPSGFRIQSLIKLP